MTTTGPTEQAASIAAAVSALHVDLAAETAWRLCEAELLALTGTLARLRSQVEATYLRAVAEVDRRRRAGVDGVRGAGSGIGSSTESFLRTSAPLTPSQARADAAAARALDPEGPLREMEPLLAAGEVTRAHVDVAARCMDQIPVHLRTSDADRATIAGYFATLAPTRHALRLKQDGGVLLQQLAPDRAEHYDPRAFERRFLDMTTDSTGMLVGRFALDAAAGATFQAAVDAASAPQPAEEGTRDDRTPRARRADALVELAETSMATKGPLRGERPRVVVHTTAEQLAGMLVAGAARTDAGTPLGPEALRRVACDSVIQRVVWDRDGTLLESRPLDLGREHRLADVHLRRALAARDRGCVIPGCHARPAHCDAHHVVHWADGGPTSLTNTTLLCGSHHTAVHNGTWSIAMGPDGIPYVVPPERIDPLRRPRRAPHHDVDELLEALRPRPRDSDDGDADACPGTGGEDDGEHGGQDEALRWVFCCPEGGPPTRDADVEAAPPASAESAARPPSGSSRWTDGAPR